MPSIECEGRTIHQINLEIRRLVAAGEREISLLNPRARHNLAVAIVEPFRIVIEGSVLRSRSARRARKRRRRPRADAGGGGGAERAARPLRHRAAEALPERSTPT